MDKLTALQREKLKFIPVIAKLSGSPEYQKLLLTAWECGFKAACNIQSDSISKKFVQRT